MTSRNRATRLDGPLYNKGHLITRANWRSLWQNDNIEGSCVLLFRRTSFPFQNISKLTLTATAARVPKCLFHLRLTTDLGVSSFFFSWMPAAYLDHEQTSGTSGMRRVLVIRIYIELRLHKKLRMQHPVFIVHASFWSVHKYKRERLNTWRQKFTLPPFRSLSISAYDNRENDPPVAFNYYWSE